MILCQRRGSLDSGRGVHLDRFYGDGMSTVDRGERHGGSDSRGESGWICLMMGWRYCHLLNTKYFKNLKVFF